MKRLILIIAFAAIAAGSALADIARPDPAKTPKTKPSTSIATAMDIRLDPDAKEARLIIPKSQLKQLRAQLDGLDDADDNTAAVTTPSFSRTQTIMSGAFLSLAIVFGGMWFARSGKAASKTVKTIVVATAIVGIASAATFVYANAGPPSEARSITGKMFSPAVHMYGFGWGQIKLETTDMEQPVRLIVPNPKDKPAEE
jgi:hypothetical protein